MAEEEVVVVAQQETSNSLDYILAGMGLVMIPRMEHSKVY